MSIHRNVRSGLLSAAALSLLAAVSNGQTGYTITGGMSNFDVHNQCDDPCDEFEIEIEGVHPEDIVGTYHNGNYGAPRVLLSSDGTFTIVDYHNPSHLTAVGSIEHFGVSLRQLSAANAVRVRWMRNGAPATVNGRVPVFGGGTAPATQPMLPSIAADMTMSSTGGDGIGLSVTNNDPNQWIWIKRRAQLYIGGQVFLEDLMTNDPVVTQSIPLDASPVALLPGQTMTIVSDLVEVEDNQSIVFAAQYFQDIGTVGPFNNSHTIGPELGNVMTASIAAPGTGCEYSQPVIRTQPVNTDAPEGRTINLRVDADGNDLTLSYQWLKDGQPLFNNGDYAGVNGDELSIDELRPATEGFYSVRISNSCGTIVSNSALVFITGHNVVQKPLSASIDPTGITAAVGDTIMLTGACAFVPPGTSYIWKHQGTPLTEGDAGASVGGGFVTGASGTADGSPAVLFIDNAQASDAGDYTITYTNAAGSAVSNHATVTINVPCGLSIDVPPASNFLCLGSTAAFDIAVTADPSVTFEWQLGTDTGEWYTLTEAGTPITCGGSTGSAFATPAGGSSVMVGMEGCTGLYGVRCIVTDGCGSLASDPALLVVADCVPCIADFNQDGGVDGGDIDAFFMAWESGDQLADANQDGGVDGADVDTFFAAWENGGC